MQVFNQKELLKPQEMLQNTGDKENVENAIERQVHFAARKYFLLYVRDWAENHHIETNSQEFLIEILKDFYYFIQQYAEEHDLEANGREFLIEILKDSFYFIQQYLEEPNDK